MSFRFQFRRGTTAERNASNPILAAGEPAVVLDSGQPAELVLGDGVTAMADLRAAVWDDDARLALAGTATQPGDLGTAAATDATDYATAPQGAKADTAVQAGHIGLATALVPLAAALRSGADTSVLLIGDSTGNATDEWFYLFSEWLATQFPAYAVEHRLWNDTTKAYSRPTYIQTGPLGLQYAYLPGTISCLRQQQATGLTVGGDLDLRAKVAPDDWTPAANGLFVARFGGGGDRVTRFGVNTTGNLTFDWSADGTAIRGATSTVPTGFTNGSVAWVRATLDCINGGGIQEIRFYTSLDDAVTWTQLGDPVTYGSATSVFTGGTGEWEIGGRGWSGELLAGKWYEVEVRNGIGDNFPLIVAPLSNAWYRTSASTPDTRGGSPVLTILNGSISGGNITANFSPQLAGMVPPWRYSVAIISTSHNEDAVGSAFKTLFNTFAANVAARTLCPVAAVAQNPQTAPRVAGQINAQRQRAGDLAAWSHSGAGRGYLNAYQSFVDDGRAMSLLVSPGDGVHPTAAGSQLWADTLAAALAPLL